MSFPVDVKSIITNPLAVGNATAKFRDGFLTAQPDLNIWDLDWTNQGASSITNGGDTGGSSYLRINMSPSDLSEVTITSKEAFKLPNRFIYGVSQSQRVIGQELEISLVGVDANGVVETGTALPTQAISGTISITSNVATINFATPHSFKPLDRVMVTGNADTRINTAPVVVTVITNLQITVPLTLANGTYTAGGQVVCINAGDINSNVTGFLYENSSLTNGTFFSKRNNARVRYINSTIATNTATQLSTQPFSDAFNMANVTEIIPTLQDVSFSSRAPDSFSSPVSASRWTTVPDEEKEYKIRIRAKNLTTLSRPVAKITLIEKTGTTTATVTTSAPHGLTALSFVQIQGVRDIVNFPSLASTQVASIISPTQFTIIIGTATTSLSAGGMVVANFGSVTSIGTTGLSVQSIARTNNVLTVTMNTTATNSLNGEYWHLYGCDATSMGLYDGAYKVLRMNGSTYELESIGANFTTINCGGSLMRGTDHRLHSIQMLEYTRHIVEMFNQNGTGDISRSLPVSIPAGVVVNSGTITTVTGVTTIVNAGTPAPPATPFILNSASGTNGSLILTGTSGLHAFYATNTGATPAFVKLYNKATAPTVGTDIPAMILPIAAAVGGVPGVSTLPIGHQGFRFALGLGIAITGAVGDTDTTAVAAGQVKVILSRTI